MTDAVGPFLYRRLARWAWCQFRLPGRAGGKVRLKSKWDVASFQDVLCHPYYWQALAHLTAPPKLVVDAGAHCGHFSVLARTLADAGLAGRATVHLGLLGGRGRGTLWVDENNYLASGSDRHPGRTPVEAEFVDLGRVLPPGPIDVLKLDVEGAEYEFVENNPDVLGRVNLLVAEVHADRAKYDAVFVPAVGRAGLDPCGEPMVGHAGCQLAVFRRGGR